MTAGFNTAYMKNKLYTSFFATLRVQTIRWTSDMISETTLVQVLVFAADPFYPPP